MDLFGEIQRISGFDAEDLNTKKFKELFAQFAQNDFLVDVGLSEKALPGESVSDVFPVVLPVIWKLVPFYEAEWKKPGKEALKQNTLFRNIGHKLLGHDVFTRK